MAELIGKMGGKAGSESPVVDPPFPDLHKTRRIFVCFVATQSDLVRNIVILFEIL